MKLFTEIRPQKLDVSCSTADRIMMLGSCFSDVVGKRMLDGGFDVCINPFGALYNPLTITAAVRRLDSGKPFTKDECVPMGAGAGMICSFSHHTSFARPTVQAFLDNANKSLAEASAFWKTCNKVIITLGTAHVWNHERAGIVANCLKRNESEFRRYMLEREFCERTLSEMVLSHPDKQFIFTVSPIRHLSQGAHENTLSKSILHLSVLDVIYKASKNGITAAYFPAWEIMNDELRDYRFYAADLVHPSTTAEEIIWERFLECAVPPGEHAAIRAAAKESRRNAHRPILDTGRKDVS